MSLPPAARTQGVFGTSVPSAQTNSLSSFLCPPLPVHLRHEGDAVSGYETQSQFSYLPASSQTP